MSPQTTEATSLNGANGHGAAPPTTRGARAGASGAQPAAGAQPGTTTTKRKRKTKKRAAAARAAAPAAATTARTTPPARTPALVLQPTRPSALPKAGLPNPLSVQMADTLYRADTTWSMQQARMYLRALETALPIICGFRTWNEPAARAA